ncbi:phage tail sheath family protein, partial [Kitasatospora sp. NPDC057512]
MPSYLTPGVYVEEVQSGARPIEGVGTAVAAFVGFAETGPFHEPTLVTNWDQYVQRFGGFTEGTYLAHSVYGFFANGGGSAYVVRVGDPARRTPGAAPAVTAAPPVEIAGFLFSALPGAGGEVSVEVVDAEGENVPDDRFRLLVRRGAEVVETYDVSTRKSTKGYVVTQLRESKLVAVAEQPGT